MDIPVGQKTKVGTCIQDEKPSPVQKVCALREMPDDVIQGVGESQGIPNLLESAAQNMIMEGVLFQELGMEQKDGKTTERVTNCAHSSAHHGKVMDSALWSKLPEELLELVFECLPWPQIYRVQILSKGWNQKLMSGATDSQLKRACARAQPKLFALLVPRADPGSFTVNMFDVASNKWHTFETSLGLDPKCGRIQVSSASDGGLVCFLLNVQSRESKKSNWVVFVSNPLTRVWKQLPPLSGIILSLIMVQLIMDHEAKHYRVVFVGDGKVGNLVNVYHSETGQWTTAERSSFREVVYGFYYNFYFEPKKLNYLPNINTSFGALATCSYNFADGLVQMNDINSPTSYDSKFILVRDHLFLLTKNPGGGLHKYYIHEYEAVDCRTSWTLLKRYSLDRLPSNPHIQPDDTCWIPTILACKDYLLLFVCNEFNVTKKHPEFLFIYEFS